MNNNLKILMFALVLFVAISTVSATAIDDSFTESAQVESVDTPSEAVNVAQSNDIKSNNIENTPLKQANSGSIDVYNTSDQATIEGYMNTYDTLNFIGEFENMNLNVNNGVTLTSNAGAVFKNSQLAVKSNGVTIRNLVINNTDNTSGSAILVENYNSSYIYNNTISVTKTNNGETLGIVLNTSNNSRVIKNNISIAGYPQDKDWVNQSNVWIPRINVAGIVVDGSQWVWVRNNLVNVTNSVAVTVPYSSNEGITIRNSDKNVSVTNNTINVTGADYNYGITLDGTMDGYVANNRVNVTGENYINDISIIEAKGTYIYNNTLYGYCYNTSTTPITSNESVAYGIYLSTNYGESQAYDNDIISNTIDLDATIAYGIELYIADNNSVKLNTITVRGNIALAIALYNSSGNGISGNNISVYANNDRTLKSIYEQIPAETTGIKIVGNESSINNIMSFNSITVRDIGSATVGYAVIIEAISNTVTLNTLLATNVENPTTANQKHTGNNAVQTYTYNNLVIGNN